MELLLFILMVFLIISIISTDDKKCFTIPDIPQRQNNILEY